MTSSIFKCTLSITPDSRIGSKIFALQLVLQFYRSKSQHFLYHFFFFFFTKNETGSEFETHGGINKMSAQLAGLGKRKKRKDLNNINSHDLPTTSLKIIRENR